MKVIPHNLVSLGGSTASESTTKSKVELWQKFKQNHWISRQAAPRPHRAHYYYLNLVTGIFPELFRKIYVPSCVCFSLEKPIFSLSNKTLIQLW